MRRAIEHTNCRGAKSVTESSLLSNLFGVLMPSYSGVVHPPFGFSSPSLFFFNR